MTVTLTLPLTQYIGIDVAIMKTDSEADGILRKLASGQLHADLEDWSTVRRSSRVEEGPSIQSRPLFPLGEMGVNGDVGIFVVANWAAQGLFSGTMDALMATPLSALSSGTLAGVQGNGTHLALLTGPSDWEETYLACDSAMGLIAGLALRLHCSPTASERDLHDRVVQEVLDGNVALFIGDTLMPLFATFARMNVTAERLALPEPTRSCLEASGKPRVCDFSITPIRKVAWPGLRSFFSPSLVDILVAVHIRQNDALAMLQAIAGAESFITTFTNVTSNVTSEEHFRMAACYFLMSRPELPLQWLSG